MTLVSTSWPAKPKPQVCPRPPSCREHDTPLTKIVLASLAVFLYFYLFEYLNFHTYKNTKGRLHDYYRRQLQRRRRQDHDCSASGRVLANACPHTPARWG